MAGSSQVKCGHDIGASQIATRLNNSFAALSVKLKLVNESAADLFPVQLTLRKR